MNEGDILVFENDDGTSYYLTEKILERLLRSSESQIEFVFVASCHSEKTARLFHNVGAKHVICIKEDERINDKAQILFSKSFYSILYSQTKSICQAFDMARDCIEASDDL